MCKKSTVLSLISKIDKQTSLIAYRKNDIKGTENENYVVLIMRTAKPYVNVSFAHTVIRYNIQIFTYYILYNFFVSL